MDFTSINNMNSYLKTMNMQNIWKQKAANPFSGIKGSGSKAKEETYERASPFGDERLMSIKNKMQSGQKLSSDDMDYLREKDPATYDEVIKMEREKKEYQKELGRCKTKDDARILHMNKVTSTLVAVKSGTITAEVALAKLAKMAEAYEKFTESSHYTKLAENHMELAKAIEAEKAEITGNREPEIKENIENKARNTENTQEPQAVEVETGGVEAPPDSESETPKPALEAEETKPAPKPATPQPQTTYSYTPKGFATHSNSYGYAHGNRSSRGGIDVDV